MDVNYAPPRAELRQTPASLSELDIRNFTGSDYYVRKWSPKLAGQNQLAGFNWVVAFFGFVWFLYRRMYLYAALLVGAQIVLFVAVYGSFELLAPDSPPSRMQSIAVLIIAFAIRLVSATIANLLYLRKALCAAESVSPNVDSNNRKLHFQSEGGTNETAMWIGFVGSLLVNVADRLTPG